MTATESGALQAPAAGTYRIDPGRSRIAYRGKHLFGLGTVHATFSVTSGDVEVTDPVTASRVSVTVDAASFTSNSPKRDKDVTSKGLLDVATYPDISFTSREVRDEGGRWVVPGTITAHGSSAPVEVVVERITRDGDGFVLHGRADRIDRTLLGVTGSRGMVGRYLDLELDAAVVPA